jgi:hypothetical protein
MNRQRRALRRCAVLSLLLAALVPGCAVRAVDAPAHSRERSWGAQVRDALAPAPLAHVYRLRHHLTTLAPAAGSQNLHGSHDTAFMREARRQLDLARLDSLYVEALQLCDGNVHEAIFALSVATLPYRRFPAVIPLLALEVTVPVSLESVAAFDARMRALPTLLFADTPEWGDRDKLPHFFGSAWLSLAAGSPALAVAAGDAIETLESVFKLQGARDLRDHAINRLGVAWALRLRHRPATLPSTLFRHAHSLSGTQP